MTSARILATLAVLSSSAVHAEPVPLPVSICDAHNSPKTRLARGGYAFCDPDGWLTENEFIRRYRDLTGARDLDRHHTVRSRARWITSAVLGGAGLGLLAYGLATLKHG